MDMKIIAVAIAKGGTGKSMITRSIAAAAAAGGLNVLVLDLDNQQSTTLWSRRRKTALPLVKFTTENDLADELTRARTAGCELVIIDTPPARSTEAPAAVEVADLVLIPCTADVEAFEQLPRTARLARTTGKPAVAILNKATPNSRSEEVAARGVFEAMSLTMAPAVLHEFKVHRHAARQGLTAQELEPESRAAGEIEALWDWICAELQMTHSAHVHKEAVS
jgi:chromosome partitioning protein